MSDQLVPRVERALRGLDKIIATHGLSDDLGPARDVLDTILLGLMNQAARPARAWEPADSARARAESNAQLIDVDLHIDRYIVRCRERDMKPNNTEWLRWFMDDEQKARIESRRDAQTQGTDTVGVPTTWH